MTSPIRVAAWFALVFVGALFVLVTVQNFTTGYNGRAEMIPASRRRFVDDCAQREHIGETVPDACAYWLDRINKTPFWRGVDNVRDNLNLCVFWSCTDLLQQLVSTLGFSALAYVVAAGVALPCALYVRSLLAALPLPDSERRRSHWIEDGVEGGGDGSAGAALVEGRPYSRVRQLQSKPIIEET